MTRLSELMELPNGWDGPGSRKIERAAYEGYLAFAQQFDNMPAELEPIPTTGGGLRLEWDRGDFGYVAEIDADGLFMCVVGPDAADDYEQELSGVDTQALLRFYLGSGSRRV